MRAAILIVITVLIAAFLMMQRGAATADTCSDACEKAYASCASACKKADTNCFTRCINEKNSCMVRCQ